MTRKKSLFLATVTTSILLVGTFFVCQKSFTVPHMAAAIISTNEKTKAESQPLQKNEDLVFSKEAVSNIASKDVTRDSDVDSSSTIMIDAETKNKTSMSELVIEKTYSGNQEAKHSVSYKYDTNTVINDIQTLSNNARSKGNLSAFVFDAKLAQLALDRSEDMAKNNYFSHTALDGCDLECRFKNSEYDTLTWGENLAEFEPYSTITASKLASELVEEWLQSSEHRRNLMSSEFTHEGIGVATFGNRIVVTVIFAKP